MGLTGTRFDLASWLLGFGTGMLLGSLIVAVAWTVTLLVIR